MTGLNPEQEKAVKHVEGPILVLAGAGSGKTRVLTQRVAYLISEHGVRPDRILAVTFTNKATEEMRERLRALLAVDKAAGKLPWIATFHSMCLRILRRHADRLGYKNDFVVYDAQDTKVLLREILKEKNIDEKEYELPSFIRGIDRLKNNGQTVEDFSPRKGVFFDELLAQVYASYQQKLFDANAMDFGDLLLNTQQLLRKEKEVLGLYQRQLEFVLVDEFQDTNQIQYQIIQMLSHPRRNLFVVGDDDQSIYAFRGATVENILHFEKDYPETEIVRLEQNYRSTATILDAGNAVVGKNKKRKEKKLWTEQGNGKSIGSFCGIDEAEEAEFVARTIESSLREGRKPGDIAVFYRTNAQSRAIEDALTDRAIQYRIFGGLKFYERKEIKDILAYLRLILNTGDNHSFLRVVNTPARGIGAKTVNAVIDLAREKHTSLFGAAKELAKRHKGLAKFSSLLEVLTETAVDQSVDALVKTVAEESGYLEKLRQSKDPTAQSRIENILELESIARKFSFAEVSPREQLQDFLDKVSLTAGDERPEEEIKEDEEFVSLMTLHLAKGLEFPVVFLTGMEEGLLPHYRSIEEGSVDEERRLCYVGITRAREELYLSRASWRGMFSSGGTFGFGGQRREPSRFAYDIPETCFEDASRFLEYEEESSIELDGEETQGWKKSPRKKKSLIGAALDFAVQTADSIQKSCDYTEGLEPLALESISEGIEVVHPSFGLGRIEKIAPGPKNNPKKARVTVFFDELGGRKKLIFQYARLCQP